MEVKSLGFRTDLGLLALGGSDVEDRGDCLVVRTPENPTFHWGNFLLLPDVPPRGEAERWIARFRAELPGVTHVSLGFDGTQGKVSDVDAFANLGLKVEVMAVMTASAVHEPPRPNQEGTYRMLVTDADWAQQVELGLAADEDGYEPVTHREFLERKARATRGWIEQGHGAWFGAFSGDRLLSSMGLFRAGEGLARFQTVATHPEARGRGLAGTLVRRVGEYGFSDLGARTLVMAADPNYSAIRIYRSVGFSVVQSQLQAEGVPHEAGMPDGPDTTYPPPAIDDTL